MVKNVLLFTTGFLLASLIWSVLVFGLRAFDKENTVLDSNNTNEIEDIVGKKWYFSSDDHNLNAHIEINKDGTFSGFSGCNTFGGKYTHKNTEITFLDIFSTEMYCEEFMDAEELFLSNLKEVTSYTTNSKWLKLYKGAEVDSQNNVMTFYANTILASNLSGSWKLDKIVTEAGEEDSVSDNSYIEITSEGEISGKVCNSLSGTFTIDIAQENNLQISNIASTKMFCAEPEGLMEQEYTVSEVLSNAKKFEIQNNKLRIYSDEETYLVFGMLDKPVNFMTSL